MSAVSTRSRRHRSRLASRTYSFAISALATFFLGLNLWPSPPDRYEATIRLRCCGAQSDAAARSLITRSLLAEVLSASGEKSDGAAVEQFQIERLHVTEGAIRGDRQVTVRIEAPSRGRAVLIAEHLADRLTSLPAGDDAGIRMVAAVENQQWRQLRRDEESARQRLDTFVERQLHRPLTDVPPAGSEPNRPPLSDDVTFRPVSRRSAASPAAGASPNPEWQALSDQIDAARQRRGKLLERLTPLHPEVIALDAQISELERRRNGVPRTIEEAPAPVQPPPTERNPAAPPPHKDLIELERTEWQRGIERYEALRREYDTARQRREQAEGAASATPAQARLSPAAQVELQEPARVAALSEGGISLWRVLLLVVMSLSIGGAVALAVAGRNNPQAAAINDVATLQQAIGLPLVGELHLDDPPPLQPPVAGSRWSVWLVLACEVVIGLLALGFLILALADSPYAREIMHRPLDGISQIGARLFDLLI